MKAINLAVPVIAGLILGGCASTSSSEMSSVREMAERAMQRAEAAEAKADQAMRAAQDAQSCCAANTQRINRAFEEAMKK
jgi:sensor c-di-GMP phosphodiesterase-like protein